MRCLLLALPFFLLLPLHAQTGLSPDQQTLLEEVQAAFAARDAWESYSQSTQQTINFALTITGTDVQRWQTDALVLESAADYNLQANAARGTVTVQQRSTRYDSNPINQTQTLYFVKVNNRTYAGENEDQLTDVSRQADKYAPFELSELTDLGHEGHFTLPPELLENALAVFDLGVGRDAQRREIQSYELELDFAKSLPYLDFNLDAFVGRFNGMVELGSFSQLLGQTSSLKLQVVLDRQSRQLLATTLMINIALEIEGADVVAVAAGDGLFSLDYGLQQQTRYYNVGEDLEIKAP